MNQIEVRACHHAHILDWWINNQVLMIEVHVVKDLVVLSFSFSRFLAVLDIWNFVSYSILYILFHNFILIHPPLLLFKSFSSFLLSFFPSLENFLSELMIFEYIFFKNHISLLFFSMDFSWLTKWFQYVLGCGKFKS